MRIRIIQKFLDKLRGKKKFVLFNEGNNNQINYRPEDERFLNIRVSGNNNKVVIKGLSADSGGKIFVDIFGDNNTVSIDENFCVGVNLFVTLGSPSPLYGKVENVSCSIGKNVRMEDVAITTYNSHNNITVGDNCLFSLKVNLFNTDGHPMYDAANNLINFTKDMSIGDGCWIGYGSTLLKGSVLPKGTIVGWGSVVCKRFSKSNCVVAGNPAAMVKENVFWSKGPDKTWLENKK